MFDACAKVHAVVRELCLNDPAAAEKLEGNLNPVRVHADAIERLLWGLISVVEPRALEGHGRVHRRVPYEQVGCVSIGILNEGHLHRSLKELYVQPGDQTEALVDGYVVDILRGDLIVEVQTASFSKIARKMRDLVADHRVRLVYPVPRDLWIVKLPRMEGDATTRRKSPKRRDFLDVFAELVSFSELIAHPNFQLDVVITAEETVWQFQPGKRWRRRGWVTIERRLLTVYETRSLHTTDDYLCALPPALPDQFLTSDLAHALSRPRPLAQKMAYCLRKSGLIERVGTQGKSMLYAKVGGALAEKGVVRA